MKKLSELLKEKQAVVKTEIINVIKNALPQDGSKMEFDLDKWRLSIGYSVSCECFDDLDFLYVANDSVLASFCQEPDNEIEIEDFHESSLIDVVDYLERHGFISQAEAGKTPHEDEQSNMMGIMKFKGKEVGAGDWRFCTSIDVSISGTVLIGYERVIPETVGLFTGLYDKKEKGIYGGDILKVYIGNGKYELRQVYWWQGGHWTKRIESYGFYGKEPQTLSYYFTNDIKVEVIGNIHDNSKNERKRQ